MMGNLTVVNLVLSVIIVAALIVVIVYAIRSWRTVRRDRAQGGPSPSARSTPPR